MLVDDYLLSRHYPQKSAICVLPATIDLTVAGQSS